MNSYRLPFLAVALVATLAACATTSTGGPTADRVEADVTVTAADMTFEPGTATAPAGRAFTLALVNEDAMPHNVAIYTDESRSEKLFEGEIVVGSNGTVVYDVPALEPGEYFLDCSLHPDVTGTLVVGG